MMWKSLLLICCIFAPAIFARSINDGLVEWEGRVVGGQTAVAEQFPYIASLRTTANFHFCGGSVINNRWIVSAAHCTVGRLTTNTFVVLGALQLSTGGVRMTLSRIVNHPNYTPSTIQNDISVVQTSDPIVFTSAVQSIPLGANVLGGGVRVTIAGWGQTSNPGSAPDLLQFVDKNTLTNEDCRSRLGIWQRRNIFDSSLCTFERSGVGACMGDSGGPLTAAGQLVGAVSWGIPCARGSPDVFARISSFRSWILGVAV